MDAMYREMSAPRKPTVDPAILREFTVRRGANKYWWMVVDNKWKPVGDHRSPSGMKEKKRSTRKKGKVVKAWEKTMGVIMVRYNVAEECDLKDRPTCNIPDIQGDGGWSFSNPFLPYSPKEKYAHNDEYAGKIEYMDSFKARLKDTFRQLKEQGKVTEFTIIDVPFRERSALLK